MDIKIPLLLLFAFLVLLSGCPQPSGNVALSENNAPPGGREYVCWDGNVYDSLEKCPKQQRSVEFVCPDGNVVKDERDCRSLCPDKCEGATLFTEGRFVDGNCTYLSQAKSSIICGSDACEGVTCGSRCEGSNYLKNGKCSNGECTYETEENSSQCSGGTSTEFDLNVMLQGCFYGGGVTRKSINLFFTIRNLGNEPVKKGLALWLKGEHNELYSARPIQKDYPSRRIIFDEKDWREFSINWTYYPHQGDYFGINDYNFSKNYFYRLILCPAGVSTYANDCDEGNGTVIYEGYTKECKIIG